MNPDDLPSSEGHEALDPALVRWIPLLPLCGAFILGLIALVWFEVL